MSLLYVHMMKFYSQTQHILHIFIDTSEKLEVNILHMFAQKGKKDIEEDISQ